MKRVKRRRVNWPRVLLAVLALALVVVGVLAVIKWIGLGKAKQPADIMAEATPIPMATADPADRTEEATEAAEPTNAPSLPFADAKVSPAESLLPEANGFTCKIMYNGEEQSSWQSPRSISFESGSAYTDTEGILTFACGNRRSAFSFGNPQVEDGSFLKLWSAPVGSLSMNGIQGSGTGWTGQPIIVRWSDEVKSTLGVYDKYKELEGFTEVIYPAMDGSIYFLELTSGEQTRQPINLGVITNGTAALDPRGYPLLYTGQGATSTDGGYAGAWLRVIDLISNQVIYKFGGKDPFSPRAWQAYDSSPLINAETDTLIMPGENGVIYFVHLNTSFNAEAGTVGVSPDPLLKYKYAAEGYSSNDEPSKPRYGFESSCACWRNYLYITDNGGYLQCIDMNTLRLEYVLDVTDDSDASVVIEEDGSDGCVYLYTAGLVSGISADADSLGYSFHRKFNALTGELVWENKQPAYYDKSSSNGGGASFGGTPATPHVGSGEIEDLVIFSMNCADVTYTDSEGQSVTGRGGLIIAYDKRTGQEVWRYTQQHGYISSPAVVYSADGKAYIVQADVGGVVALHSAKDGRLITSVDLGGRIESTPAVFNGVIVLGTRGEDGSGQNAAIFGIRLD